MKAPCPFFARPGQRLANHLVAVSQLAWKFATAASDDARFCNAARQAGLLHDLGKYSDEFQEMLRECQEGKPKARVEHSGQGAALALAGRAFDVAFVVAGHHAGLKSPSDLRRRVERHPSEILDPLVERAARDLEPATAALLHDFQPTEDIARDKVDLRIRMLFSCLIDADRLDAGGADPAPRTLMDPASHLDRLMDYVRRRAATVPVESVKEVRRSVLESCLTAAERPQRLLSLTVPTGGGKTLASMAFALKRAVARASEVRRIFAVIPYLSIIEQNAQVYAEVLGSDSVLEHHSGDLTRLKSAGTRFRPEPEGESDAIISPCSSERLATENWNAPLVVTVPLPEILDDLTG